MAVGLCQGCAISLILFWTESLGTAKVGRVPSMMPLGCISRFADDVVLLASSDHDLQRTLFTTECDTAGMRISTGKMVDCSPQVGTESVPQVKEFKYLTVLWLLALGSD